MEVDITSGYFGLYKKYKQMVIDSPALTRVIAASPEVSGITTSAIKSDGEDVADILRPTASSAPRAFPD